MQQAIDALHESLDRVEHLGGLHKALMALTTSAVDSSDILRAQIVLAVSALDYYVHEITALGMVEIYEQKRPPTNAFLKYRVTLGSLALGGAVPSGSGWFAGEVRERHGFLSFQQPDKIADAVRLFSPIRLWSDVAARLSLTEEATKSKLRLIVDRRNKIAHEADIDPSYPGARWPISEGDAVNTIQFIRVVCDAIHSAI